MYTTEEVNFDWIRKNGFLLYEYVRGSQLYGLARPESDIDHGGIYMEPLDALLGHGIGFPEDVKSEKNDDSWFSLRKFIVLLTKSNPNILEALYIPSDKILYKHPVMDILLKERDKFVTKQCFDSFIGYSKGQIVKARSLKKKIVKPWTKAPEVIDYVYTDDFNQGTMPVKDYLKQYGLHQECFGLVNLPHAKGVFKGYYDWGKHWMLEGRDVDFKSQEEFEKALTDDSKLNIEIYGSLLNLEERFDLDSSTEDFYNFVISHKKPFGYKGILNAQCTSNTVREVEYSSIPKGEDSICQIYFQTDEYQHACREYRDWVDFDTHKNEERFKEAADGKGWDAKNMLHSARLLNMGIEIARGEGIKLDRTNIDRDFLMKIRNSEFSYSDIMDYIESKNEEMITAMDESEIPDDIDPEFLNDILIKMRREFYGLPL